MKKTLLSLTLLVLIIGGLLISAHYIQAQVTTTTQGPLEKCTIRANGVGMTECPASTECIFASNDKCGVCCLLNALYNVTDWFFVIIVALAGIFVVIGAMTLLMSAGDPSKVSSGRNYIMYAIIGLIVGFLAKAIPSIVRLAVGA